MYFEIQSGAQVPFEGRVIYEKSEYSFDYYPSKINDYAYTIGYMSLCFDAINNSATQIYGLNPYTKWEVFSEELPVAKEGKLICKQPIPRGMDKRLIDVGQWITHYNYQNNVICIGDVTQETTDHSVCFAKDCIAILSKIGELKAVWLYLSEMLPDKEKS